MPPASISCSWSPTRRRDPGTTDNSPSPRGTRGLLLGGRGLAAGIRGFRRADLEAGGDHRGRCALLVEEVVEDLDRLVGHLVRPLADIVVAEAGLQQRHLRRKIVTEGNHQLLGIDPRLLQRYRLAI